MGEYVPSGSSWSTHIGAFRGSSPDLSVGLAALPTTVPTGEEVELALTVTAGPNALSGVEVEADVPAGTSYVAGSASCGGTYDAGAETLSFSIGALAANAAQVCTFRIAVDPSTSTPALLTFLDDHEDGPDGWAATAGAGSQTWSIDTGNPFSGANAWFAPDVSGVTDQYLTLAAPVVLPEAPTLTFRHAYSLESGYDGGVVELSSDGGATWTDLGSAITQQGYDGTLASCLLEPHRRASGLHRELGWLRPHRGRPLGLRRPERAPPLPPRDRLLGRRRRVDRGRRAPLPGRRRLGRRYAPLHGDGHGRRWHQRGRHGVGAGDGGDGLRRGDGEHGRPGELRPGRRSVAVEAVFAGVAGAGDVRVCRVGAPSSSAVGIEEAERMGHFWTVEVDGGLQFSDATAFRFDVSEIPYSSIQNAALLNGYARPAIGAGPFSAVATTFDGDDLVVTGIAQGVLAGRAFAPVAEITFAGATGALPVELTAFDATLDGADVLLVWETASETANAGFEVQAARVADGRTAAAFASVGFVEGAGTTDEPQRYGFRLADAEPGTYRLCLRQVDFDGTAVTLPAVEISVGLARALTLSAPAPNPVRQRAQLTFTVPVTGDATLAVYDVLGREVARLFDGRADAERRHTVTLEAAGLAAGTYVVRLDANGRSAVERVAVVR